MQASSMKNMLILKSTKKSKKLEKINKKIDQIQPIKKEKDYILKEAEMLIEGYITKLENNHKQKQFANIKNNKKYKKLRTYAYISSAIIFIQALLLIVK